ncbi:bacteriophage Gp15 family protein [Virgibacillus chiguensis]|uniref:Bacteriophage Gp15 protein n=1 Tax=Virgibacillus chiguensis TaxID=411959 RepID=A0A1M5XR86_9BACI|nr:bacteriophage Gp15 family protein [Virgibacillus chiguensis]SHI01773.1 Bacteriophage Gp15 protein [Virgibacillus chiguensis]
MRLNDPLVTSFEYDGKEYAIDLAFDNVLDVFDVLNDELLRDYEKAEICLILLFGEQPFDEAITIDLWNHVYESFIYIENEQPIEYDLKGNPLPVQHEEQKQLIDLDKDAEYIFASFQQAYGMNLYQEQGSLHWHEFQSLLQGLPDDTIMKRIIQIRQWEPSKGESTEYKQSMRKLQKIYALDDDDQEEVE